ncbi:MAG: UDP-N-acetylmuramoyl-L-alanyl-D-glutamate--2,6-diaminopimelate ligase [bacterium]
MDLWQLLTALPEKEVRGESANPAVTGVTQDSRCVEPGFVFVCISGYCTDGHNYIEDAVQRGAVAVIVEKDLAWAEAKAKETTETQRHRDTRRKAQTPDAAGSAVLIRVRNGREALALLSAAFYRHPSASMRVIGITGTNGKTTTSFLTTSILEAAGHAVGLTNTLICRIKGQEREADRTTPESVDLQRTLRQMVDQGCQYAVVEVSSHSLVLNRVLGCEFDVGVLTNITGDHLDFHLTFDEYRKAKLKLFTGLAQGEKRPKAAVLNLDDPSFGIVRESTGVEVLSYSQTEKASIWAERIDASRSGLRFVVHTPAGTVEIQSPLIGLHNVSNILAAIGAGVAEGISLDHIQEGIGRVLPVPGRFETIDCGQDFWVVVDFAHTADALQNLLQTARLLEPRRIMTVFGCGGDRDQSKRFPMGQVVARLSDRFIITNDNSRSEDPAAIARTVEEGVKSVIGCRQAGAAEKYEVILDRRQAIEKALLWAEAGDMVLIAGKGHEQYQIIGSCCIPFDDRQVARQILTGLVQAAERGGGK